MVEQEEQEDELTGYWKLKPTSDAMAQPLQWWKVCGVSESDDLYLTLVQKNAKDFPVLAKMARDFLAVPGASVSVECLFSSSKHICAATCSSLTASTITQALCVKHWYRSVL
jgi:hypothetical protein